MSEMRFSEEHQWMKIDDQGQAYVGITRFAADELGDITFIELPEVGKELAQNDQLCVVESVKAASDVYMPVAGKVAEVNATLDKNPSLLNESPEDQAWICRLESYDQAQFAKLMTADEYKAFCQ